jgi:thioesterase domain-containing protein
MDADALRTHGTASLRALRALLRTDMPVTEHLRITVVGYRDGDLVLHAPLGANINHKRTAFAGSLNATATLAGWATLWLILRERGIGAHAVIQDSAVHYERPVTTDFEARCAYPDPAAVDRLIGAVTRRGRGRIELSVTVSDRAGDAVTFRGRYVAVRDSALDDPE